TLILQDRRGAVYDATDSDRLHGWFGDAIHINGAVCSHLDVATRIYRFRVLNASNARAYRLGLRSADGKAMAFTLLGTDDGLLAGPRRCNEAFVASAERIDILVDLSDAAVGDTVLLETRAFDPMHMEMAAPAAAIDHAAMGHGGNLPEGGLRTMLQLRVRERIAYRATIPQRLSTIAPIDTANAM